MNGKHRALVLVIVLVALLACTDQNATESAATQEPAPLGDQEGGVCGMLVRGQSAPRGQVIHRDGTRLFFCSIGDLLVHLSTPSPHGRVVATFVEVLDPSEDPGQTLLAPHPWIAAEQAVFVIGVERRGIMGEPVLVYRDRADANAVVEHHPGALAVDFAGLEGWWAGLIEGD